MRFRSQYLGLVILIGLISCLQPSIQPSYLTSLLFSLLQRDSIDFDVLLRAYQDWDVLLLAANDAAKVFPVNVGFIEDTPSKCHARREDMLANRTCMGCRNRVPKEQLKKCSACKTVRYCSKECQKKAWKIHKRTCKIMTARLKQAKQKSKT